MRLHNRIVSLTFDILTAQKYTHVRCPFKLGCFDKQLSHLLPCIRVDQLGFLNNIPKMVQMIVKYEGALRCKVIHEPTGTFFPTDAPLDNNGKGEVVSPTDLCAAALGSCMATIIGMQMEKLSFDLTGMRVEVQKEMSESKPRRIIKLNTEIWLPMKLDDKAKCILELAAKGCPVHHSLSPEIEKPICFHWH